MKVAFVTGSNRGIGFGIVAKLAHAYGSTGEWDVYLTARNVDLGKKACEELKGRGLQVKFHQLDITDTESRKSFLAYMKAHYPDGINIAVNNAGIAYKDDSTAPFGEQARVTVHTNFTCTFDFTLEFLPLLAENARVVHVSSMCAHMTLKQLGDDLYTKFTSVMSLDELKSLVGEFVKHAEAGDHEKYGWPTTAYGVAAVAQRKASYILGDSIKYDPRHIVMNSVHGADTPFYLATLPIGVKEPINEFVSDRRIIPWSKDVEVRF
ncbi:unnamed protein product [Dicrocoelium dendriticum]|nr:unnamed protein product [Dicrocoelium dendriticum]